jgi:hypothetical protein
VNTKVGKRFGELSPLEKQLFLSELIFELSIAARNHYDDPDSARFEKLRALNEVIHVASSKLRALIEQDTRQYPDDIFLNILQEKAESAGQSDFSFALERALASAKSES